MRESIIAVRRHMLTCLGVKSLVSAVFFSKRFRYMWNSVVRVMEEMGMLSMKKGGHMGQTIELFSGF